MHGSYYASYSEGIEAYIWLEEPLSGRSSIEVCWGSRGEQSSNGHGSFQFCTPCIATMNDMGLKAHSNWEMPLEMAAMACLLWLAPHQDRFALAPAKKTTLQRSFFDNPDNMDAFTKFRVGNLMDLVSIRNMHEYFHKVLVPNMIGKGTQCGQPRTSPHPGGTAGGCFWNHWQSYSFPLCFNGSMLLGSNNGLAKALSYLWSCWPPGEFEFITQCTWNMKLMHIGGYSLLQ